MMGFWEFADKHTEMVGLCVFFICWAIIGAAEGLGPKERKDKGVKE